MKSQHGFSIVEMMISMVIGGFVVAGAVTVMSNTKKNYAATDSMIHMQENARFAMQFMSRDIRMAGFVGCSRGGGIESIPITAISSSSEESSRELSSGSGDSITLSYASAPRENWIASASDTEDENILISNTDKVEVPTDLAKILSELTGREGLENSKILFSSCNSESTHVAQVKEVSGNAITFHPPIPASMSLDKPVVTPWQEYTYEIRVAEDRKIPSLYRNDTELAEGIEFLRLLYGVDDHGGNADDDLLPDVWLSWEDVALDDNGFVDGSVTAIQVGLLVQSASNVISDGEHSKYAENAAIASDKTDFKILDIDTSDEGFDLDATRKITRRVFAQTLKVRNYAYVEN